jgi:hypothetical protein
VRGPKKGEPRITRRKDDERFKERKEREGRKMDELKKNREK